MAEKPDVLMDLESWSDNEMEFVVDHTGLFQWRRPLRLRLSAPGATVDVHTTSLDLKVDN